MESSLAMGDCQLTPYGMEHTNSTRSVEGRVGQYGLTVPITIPNAQCESPEPSMALVTHLEFGNYLLKEITERIPEPV